jgi:tubulin polyglutamylase TTLL4
MLPLPFGAVRVRLTGVCSAGVRGVFRAAGVRATRGPAWSLLWSALSLDDAAFEGLHEFQRVNHFPATWELGRKDRCALGAVRPGPWFFRLASTSVSLN